MDKFSYAIGLGIGQNLFSMGARSIDVNDFAQAIKDVLEGNQTAISHTEAREIVNKFFMELEEKTNAENIAKGKAFLEENKKNPNVVTLPSGLQYEVIKEGNGKKPKATDRVRCHYEGTLIDGTLFDSSIKRGEPAVFGVNQVIKGWVEALQLMSEGAKWKLYIPSELAYGAQGAGEMIPPHSTLIFEKANEKRYIFYDACCCSQPGIMYSTRSESKPEKRRRLFVLYDGCNQHSGFNGICTRSSGC